MARPRSNLAHKKVIQAALELFTERGIEATSMDAIARTSGVSKATIYNHWADKEALLMEVMIFVNGLDRQPQDVDSGELRRDLTTVLCRRPPGEFEAERRRMMPALIAYSAVHQEFGAAWRRRVMDPPRHSLRQILRRGIERNILPADLDLEVSIALLLGPVLYNHIFEKDSNPRGPDIGPKAAEAFCRAFALDKPSSRRPAARR